MHRPRGNRAGGIPGLVGTAVGCGRFGSSGCEGREGDSGWLWFGSVVSVCVISLMWLDRNLWVLVTEKSVTIKITNGIILLLYLYMERKEA